MAPLDKMIEYKPFPESLKNLNLVCHLRLIEVHGDRVILYGDVNQCPMESLDSQLFITTLNLLRLFKPDSYHVFDYSSGKVIGWELKDCKSVEQAYLILCENRLPVRLVMGV